MDSSRITIPEFLFERKDSPGSVNLTAKEPKQGDLFTHKAIRSRRKGEFPFPDDTRSDGTIREE